MNDVKRQAPFCTAAPPGERATDCGSSAAATVFFVTFVILNSYLLSNLFVAAILERVSSGLLNRTALLTPQDLPSFQVRLKNTADELPVPATWNSAVYMRKAYL